MISSRTSGCGSQLAAYHELVELGLVGDLDFGHPGFRLGGLIAQGRIVVEGRVDLGHFSCQIMERAASDVLVSGREETDSGVAPCEAGEEVR